jgi:hypothetical protein
MTCKQLQSTLTDSINAVDAIEFLKDTRVITQRAFWLLTGNYRRLQ